MMLLGCSHTASPGAHAIPAKKAHNPVTSLFLIGDAGEPAHGEEPVLLALSQALQSSRGETFVVFLGDNLYPSGLPAESDAERPEMERRLGVQIQAILKTRARGVFVPGNHDWDHSGQHGWVKIRRQDTFVDDMGQDRVRMLPDRGCPGPDVEDVGEVLRVVFLDTQWWLHPGSKPVDGSSGCQTYTPQQIGEALSRALREADNRHVVIAAHHPPISSSKHGGYFTWKDHLFPLTRVRPWLYVPLPLIGSIYPLSRQLGINNQDLAGRANREMRAALARAMQTHPPLIFAGGHEHTLEVHKGTFSEYVLVSGAGIFGHASPVHKRAPNVFAIQAPGFMRVDIWRDGQVRLGVLTVDQDANTSEVFSLILKKPRG